VEVAGSVALVAGGGGLLGSVTAARLLAHGAEVMICDLTEGRSRALLTEHGGRARFMRFDVTDDAAVAAACAEANRDGRFRILIATVGTGFAKRTLAADGTLHDVASFQQMLDQHVLGSFVLIRRAAEAMAGNQILHGERGVIVLTSSLAGLEGSAGQIAYGSAKAAVAGMVLPAARDLAPLGIRVMAIAPGAMAEPDAGDPSDERVAALINNVVHPRRLGTPDEYALLATQIVEHPYLNGSVIRLDGGARLGLKY